MEGDDERTLIIEKMAPTELVELGNPWDRITDIAARVGVKPLSDPGCCTVYVQGRDGEQYDLWAVVTATLDYIDAKSADQK